MEDKIVNWSPYAKEYDPLKAGSIDGTDTEPHDRAVSRAMITHYEPPHGLKSKPDRTLFVSRFGPYVSKQDLKECFSRYGQVVSVKIIVDIVTGLSQGYGFVEMKTEDEARWASKRVHDTILKGSKIFVDFECSRTMKGWKPRRLGGGFGGKKESGQLRFGGKDRPFKKPILPGVVRQREETNSKFQAGPGARKERSLLQSTSAPTNVNLGLPTPESPLEIRTIILIGCCGTISARQIRAGTLLTESGMLVLEIIGEKTKYKQRKNKRRRGRRRWYLVGTDDKNSSGRG